MSLGLYHTSVGGELTQSEYVSDGSHTLDSGTSFPGGATATDTFYRTDENKWYMYTTTWTDLTSQGNDLSAIGEHLLPSSPGTYDLGSASAEWNDLWLLGRAYLQNTDDVDLVGVSGSLIIGGDGTGQHIAIDGNEIMSKSDATTAGVLNMQVEGGTTRFGSDSTGTDSPLSVYTTGAVLFDNPTTGATASSPELYLRGNYWNDPSNIQQEVRLQAIASSVHPYLAIWVDDSSGAPTEIVRLTDYYMSLKGNLLVSETGAFIDIDDTRTGATYNSGYLNWSGNYFSVSDYEVEARAQVIVGTDPYLRFGVDTTGTSGTLGYPLRLYDDSISPNASNTTDIGTSALEWKDAYLAGTLYFGINQDTVLYKSADNVLATNDSFLVDAGSHMLTSGLRWGASSLGIRQQDADTAARIEISPNGTGAASNIWLYNSSDGDNTGRIFLYISGSAAGIEKSVHGTGTPVTTFYLEFNTLPKVADTYDLGSGAAEWKNLYLGTGRIYLYTDQGESVRSDGTQLIWSVTATDELKLSATALYPNADAGLDLGTTGLRFGTIYGDNITITSPPWGTGTVTSVAAGDGMNFTTITGSGSVTMGAPSAVTQASSNSASGTTHTHAWTHTSSGGWDTAASHVTADGSSHTYINQSITTAATPAFTKIYATDTADITLTGLTGALIIAQGSGGNTQHIAIDGNEIMSKSNNTTAGQLYLQANGGSISVGAATTFRSVAVIHDNITTGSTVSSPYSYWRGNYFDVSDYVSESAIRHVSAADPHMEFLVDNTGTGGVLTAAMWLYDDILAINQGTNLRFDEGAADYIQIRQTAANTIGIETQNNNADMTINIGYLSGVYGYSITYIGSGSGDANYMRLNSKGGGVTAYQIAQFHLENEIVDWGVDMLPDSNTTYDLGSTSFRWAWLYGADIDLTRSGVVDDTFIDINNTNTTADFTPKANIVFSLRDHVASSQKDAAKITAGKDAAGVSLFDGTLTFAISVNDVMTNKLQIIDTQITALDDIRPSPANTYDLGSASAEWQDIYLGTGRFYMYTDQGESMRSSGTSIVWSVTATDELILTAAELRPNADAGLNLGTDTIRFGTGYFDNVDTNDIRLSNGMIWKEDGPDVYLMNANGEEVFRITDTGDIKIRGKVYDED